MIVRHSALFLVLCVSVLATAGSADNNAVTSHIPHDAVVSTGIVSIGYSRRLHILEIEFVNGAVYRYLEVAPSIHRDLMAADSKARYYDANIKGNYSSVRVRPRPKH
jgi:KTSC domain-containing protein